MHHSGTEKKIVVVGAGASGMMAAISAARELGDGTEICILEKNEKAGRKLLATGNGRCNFTNARCTSWDYSGAFLEKKESFGFPESVMYQAPPKRIMEVFGEMGVLPREEEEGRVYPFSGQGASVCQALQYELERLGVEIRYGTVLKKAEPQGGAKGFRLTMANGSVLCCDRLILAVGGKAGCQYGSEGDGYALAADTGHTIIKPIPALVQLTADDEAFPRLKGVRAKARVILFEKDRKIVEDRGEVQFTENGLSGICIFNLSRHVRYSGNPRQGSERYHVKLDFIEEHSMEAVLALLKARREHIGGREACAFLDGILHEKLSAALMERTGISPEMKARNFTEEQLEGLAGLLKGFDVTVTGTRSWKEAQVTAGGVDTGEIARRTMESKLVQGLYFAGELIDVDAPCGGYNLQWAFASGLVCGKAAALSLSEDARSIRGE